MSAYMPVGSKRVIFPKDLISNKESELLEEFYGVFLEHFAEAAGIFAYDYFHNNVASFEDLIVLFDQHFEISFNVVKAV